MSLDDNVADVAIVGGGPAGLQAGLKTALLYHTAVVFDKGRRHSRVFFAPNVANAPGFPGGARGSEIVKQGRAHLQAVNDTLDAERVRLVDDAEVTEATRTDDGFELTVRDAKTGDVGSWRAKALFVAAGVVDRQPWLGPEQRSITPILPYANRGLVEYCLLCDGHTVVDKKVVVIGMDAAAVGIARTLRDSFNADVTVVACVGCVTGEPDHDESAHGDLFERARAAGVPAVDGHIEEITGLDEDRVHLQMADGSTLRFDKAFLSLGWFRANNELAAALGAHVTGGGYVRTDEDCRALDADGEPVAGLYVIGDLRHETWNQVPSAWADAETAAIHAWAHHL